MKDGLKKVHSESQRMVRESSVCLPYHKVLYFKFVVFKNVEKILFPAKAEIFDGLSWKETSRIFGK